MSDCLFPITIKQGVAFTLPIAWKDSAGALISIAGYTATMKIRATLDAETPLAEYDEEDGIILTDSGDVNVQIDLNDTQTESLSVLENGVWALKLTKDGKSVDLLSGPVSIEKYAAR